MNERKQPSLLDSAAETVLLLLIVIVLVMVPLLFCEWLARLALPMPVAATHDSEQSVDAQRKLLVKCLFGTLWLLAGVWAMLAN